MGGSVIEVCAGEFVPFQHLVVGLNPNITMRSIRRKILTERGCLHRGVVILLLALIFADLALTISIAVALSVIVAITVLPAASGWLKAKKLKSGYGDGWPALKAAYGLPIEPGAPESCAKHQPDVNTKPIADATPAKNRSPIHVDGSGSAISAVSTMVRTRADLMIAVWDHAFGISIAPRAPTR